MNTFLIKYIIILVTTSAIKALENCRDIIMFMCFLLFYINTGNTTNTF